jgi:hypothetical protein
MKKLIIIVLLFIVSCNEYDHTKAIRYSKCAKDYCYGSALMRNCEMVKP